MTTVVHVHAPFDVYIGRACPRARDPRCRAASRWCNFYRPGRNGVRDRADAVARYERWLRGVVRKDPAWRDALLELRGKRLGCWCAPKACHGDAIVRVLGEILSESGARPPEPVETKR